jgi:hypothetical protein
MFIKQEQQIIITNMLSTLTSNFCSLFSFDDLSCSISQLPQVSFHAPAFIPSALLLFILLISGCGLVALQMRRIVLRTINVAEDSHTPSIDGNNLNQKGKPPEDSKIYGSARAIQAQIKANGLSTPSSIIPFAKLSEYQKIRRRVYDRFESDNPNYFSSKDVTIEHNFNQIFRKKSNGSIKELPATQLRSPLAVEQCTKIDLIKKAAVIKAEKSGKINFSLLKSLIEA